MQEQDARKLAAIPKLGEPREQWSQERPNTLTNSFGVTDPEGKSIKGMHVELEVFRSPRLGLSKYVFSLMQKVDLHLERAYQLEVNSRQGLKPTDHNATHEHFGQARISADATWINLTFDGAVTRFCQSTNLTLVEQLPDYEEFQLK